MRSTTRTFLAASALSSLGNGLTFPVSALYLERVRGLPLEAASLFFVAMAASGALSALLLGRAIDRHGPRRFVALALLSEAIGLVRFSGASSLGAVLCAGVAIGGGNGLFFTGLTPLLARLESGAALERAFSVRYWLINLGNSVGALLGGALVAALGEAALQPAYLANAATSVVLAAVVAACPLGTTARDAALTNAALRWTRPLVAVAAANALIILFGMAMFEAVVPYMFVRSAHGAVPLAHVIVAASTIAITLGQLPAGRWSERRGKARVLTVHAGIWALAAGIGLVSVGAGGATRWWLGVAYGLVFGAGECLFAAGLAPLVVRVVRPAQLARFNGVLSASFSVALAVGPAIGFGLAAHLSPYAFWAAVAVAMLAAMGLWSYVARSEPS
ncbi:MAG: MFS transporter [Kofleriaceae bacterium]